jgi:hypothetical protein
LLRPLLLLTQIKVGRNSIAPYVKLRKWIGSGVVFQPHEFESHSDPNGCFSKLAAAPSPTLPKTLNSTLYFYAMNCF